MLSQEQSKRLENLQRKALRIIFGFDKTYETLLAESNIDSLQKRRDVASLNFAQKLVISGRFKHLFPLNYSQGMNTRNRRKYYEEQARTSRLFQSPLFYFRRLLNKQSEEDGDIDEEDDLINLFN